MSPTSPILRALFALALLVQLAVPVQGCGDDASPAPVPGDTADVGTDSPDIADTEPGDVPIKVEVTDPPDGADVFVPPIEACDDAPPLADQLVLGTLLNDGEPGRNHSAACAFAVWVTAEGALKRYDFASGEVSHLANDARWPATHGTTLVYARGEPPQVVVRNKDGTETELDPSGAAQKRPRISADLVVWEDEASGRAQITSWDRKTGELLIIDPSDADQRFAAVSGRNVLWTDLRDDDSNGVWDGDLTDDAEIYGRIGDVVGVHVSAPFKQAFPELDGDRVVWLDWRDVEHDENGHPRPEPKISAFAVYQGTLIDGAIADTASAITTGSGSWQGLPSLKGGWLVWIGTHPSSSPVLGLNIDTQQEFSWTIAGADAPLVTTDRVLLDTADGLLVRSLPIE